MVIKKPILNCTEEDYDKIFAINSKAAFFRNSSTPELLGRCTLHSGGGQEAERPRKIITIVGSLLAAYTYSYAIYLGSKAPIERRLVLMVRETPLHLGHLKSTRCAGEIRRGPQRG